LARQTVTAERLVLGENLRRAVRRRQRGQRRLVAERSPAPGVAKPERRQELDSGVLGPAVRHGDAHEDVGWRPLGVFDGQVEIPVALEHAGIEQLELRVVRAAPRRLGEYL